MKTQSIGVGWITGRWIRWIRGTRGWAVTLGLALLAGQSSAEMSDAKRELIRELLEISGSQQMAEQMSIVVLSDIRSSYPAMMELAISEQPGLSEDDKQRLAARLESFDLFAEKFRARFPEKLKLPEIIAEVHYPLYDKYFTEQDLKHMVEFYRTPTGQKAISNMPALMQDAVRGTYRMAQPRVVALIQEIVAAQRAALEPAEAP